MRSHLLQLGFILALIFATSCDQGKGPAYLSLTNPDASEEAIKLFNFIQDIEGEYTLSGQHNFLGTGSIYTDQLEELTGKRPVIWGSDFSFCVEGDNAIRFQHCGPANLAPISWKTYLAQKDSMKKAGIEGPLPMFTGDAPFLDISLEEARESTIAEILEQHKKGHIITLMWHGCFPTDGDCCDGSSIWAMDNRPSPEEWDELVTPGTDLNDAWKKGADKVAALLGVLQNNDIPVLWRPYHEMNGVWFWWCNQKGDQGFKRLWIMMYEYFTEQHQLNNLVWVWNTNAPRNIPGDEAWPYEEFFPGLEYVDILAADVYHNDYRQAHHDQLVELAKGKPISLGEVGNIPTREIIEQQSRWTWFMPWAWILFTHNDHNAIKELYNSEQVLTLDEVMVDEEGSYTLPNYPDL